MAGQTITVSVLADTKRFSSAMRNLARKTGLARLGSMFRSAGRVMMRFFTRGIRYAGLFAAAIGAMAVKGGIDRALNLDAAQHQLKQFGMSTDKAKKSIEKISKLSEGTPFDTSKMSKLFSQLYANTEDSKKSIMGVKNAINVTAVSSTQDLDMVSDVFGRISSRGKVTADDMNMLARAGVPIKKILADGLHVSNAKLEDMISNGELTADKFNKVLSESKKLKGAAQDAGDTLRGMFKSVKGWVELIIGDFVTGLKPELKSATGAINDFFKSISGGAEGQGKKFGDWVSKELVPALKDAWRWLKRGFGDLIESIGDAFGEATGSSKSFGDTIGDLVTGAVKSFGYIVGGAAEGLSKVIGWMSKHKVFTKFRDGVKAAKDKLVEFGDWFMKDVWPDLKPALKKLGEDLGDAFDDIDWDKVKDDLTDMWNDALKPFFQHGAKQLPGIAKNMGEIAKAVVTISNALDSGGSNTEDSWMDKLFGKIPDGDKLKKIVDWSERLMPQAALGDQLGTKLGEKISEASEYVKEHAGEWALDAVEGMYNVGSDLLRGLRDGINDWLDTHIPALKPAFDRLVDVVKGFFGIQSPSTVFHAIGTNIVQGLLNGIRDGIAGIGGWISSAIVQPILGAMAGAGSWLVGTGSRMIRGLKNGASTAWGAVSSFFSNARSRIVGWGSAAGSWLVGAGSRAIRGLRNGASTAWGGVSKFFSNARSRIVNWGSGAGKWLSGAGGRVIRGLRNGASSAWGGVSKFFSNAHRRIVNWASGAGKWLTGGGRRIIGGLRNGASGAWGRVSKFFASAHSRIVNWASGAGKWLTSGGRRVIGGLRNGASAAWPRVSAFFSSAHHKIVSWASNAGQWLVSGGKRVIGGLRNGASSAWPRVSSFFASAHQKIVNWASNAGSWLVSGGKRVIGGLRDGAAQAWGRVTSFFSNARMKIIDWASNSAQWLVSGGKGVVSGLKDGIASAMGGIRSWLKSNVYDRIVDGMESLFDIHSPSGVFEGLGKNMIQGLTKGLFQGHPENIVDKVFGGTSDRAGDVLGKLIEDGKIGMSKLENLSSAAMDKLPGGAFGDPGGSGVKRWAGTVKKALIANGIKPASNYVNAWLKQIATESGGNPKIHQQIHDVNSVKGTPAQGLLQTIGPTFASFKKPGHGNILKGYDNTLAAIAYALATYGKKGMLKVIGKGHGYATGTSSARKGWSWVGEEGPELLRMNGGEEVRSNRDSREMGGAPSTLVVKDVDDQLIGRFRLEAAQLVDSGFDDLSHQMKRARRNGRYALST